MLVTLFHILAFVIGVMTPILWYIKVASDKFEETKEDFNWKRYVHKNKFDYLFYFCAGGFFLFVKELAMYYAGHSDIELTEYGITALCGGLGPVMWKKIFKDKDE
jgi:hypothetical protein